MCLVKPYHYVCLVKTTFSENSFYVFVQSTTMLFLLLLARPPLHYQWVGCCHHHHFATAGHYTPTPPGAGCRPGKTNLCPVFLLTYCPHQHPFHSWFSARAGARPVSHIPLVSWNIQMNIQISYQAINQQHLFPSPLAHPPSTNLFSLSSIRLTPASVLGLRNHKLLER